MRDPDGMELEFSGALWHWRGPAPFYFVTVPEEESLDLQAVSREVSYGWGMTGSCAPAAGRATAGGAVV